MIEPHGTTVAELVAAHHATIYRAAYRLCGSTADAEDLTQQAFLAAQRNLAQLRSAEAAGVWLLAIVRNCFLKECRKRKPLAAENHEIDLDTFAAAEPVPDATFDPEQLQAALASVPPEARVILHMFYFEELSYREIAEQLQVPAGTVMSRLARAKQQLRRRLTPDAPLATTVHEEVKPHDRPRRVRTK